MDLELLPDLLKRRSVLVARLTECLQEDGVSTGMRKLIADLFPNPSVLSIKL